MNKMMCMLLGSLGLLLAGCDDTGGGIEPGFPKGVKGVINPPGMGGGPQPKEATKDRPKAKGGETQNQDKTKETDAKPERKAESPTPKVESDKSVEPAKDAAKPAAAKPETKDDPADKETAPKA